MTVKSINIGQRSSPFNYRFDIYNNFAVRLTGINRAYFAGKTITWESKPAKMGLVSSYPTSYLITNDPLPMGLFIYYNPENFM